jgi:hypothetical protein
MTVLAQEIRNIQNPALGAGLLWRFVCGYVETHRTHEHVPLPLLFLVIPTLFHQQTQEFVKGTLKGSGLRAFAAKFGGAKASKQDLLLAIHDRMFKSRPLTLASLRLALATRLLHVEADGKVLALSRTQAVSGMPTEARQLMRDAEKLGSWCAPLTLHEIATTLKLRF